MVGCLTQGAKMRNPKLYLGLSLGVPATLASIFLAHPAQAQWGNPTYSLPNALAAPAGVPVAVFRGRMGGETPSWVEIADLGNGRYVLSILDGVPGIADLPQQLSLSSNGKKGSGCLLTNGTAVRIEGCPKDKALAVKIAFGKVKGSAQMQPVGVGGAFGYTGAPQNSGSRNALGQIADNCRMTILSSMPLIKGSAVPQAVANLKTQIATAQSGAPDTQKIDQLRRDRRSQFGLLTYSQFEMERLRSMEVDPSRMFDFRLQMRMAEQRNRYLQQINNTPQRNQARMRLAEIEAQLALIYDPARGRAASASVQNLASSGGITAIDGALTAVINNAADLTLDQLVAAETGQADVQSCNMALASAAQRTPAILESRTALSSKFPQVAKGFVGGIYADADEGLTSTALASRLRSYRQSPGLNAALASMGQSGALNEVDQIVASLAAREQEERNRLAKAAEAERQRVAQAAAAKENARLDAERAAIVQRKAAISSGKSGPTAFEIGQATVRAFSDVNAPAMQIYNGLGLMNGIPDFNSLSYTAAGPLSSSVTRWRISDASCVKASALTYNCTYTMESEMTADILGFKMNTGLGNRQRITYAIVYDGQYWTIPKLKADYAAALRRASANRGSSGPDLKAQQKAFYCPGNGANPLDTQAFC
jgi:hypothetical protein